MATKVIRKTKPADLTRAIISTGEIQATYVGKSFVLQEAVKQSIDVKYDSKGYADQTSINLGVQYDHRVTWLHFDLDDLIWNLDNENKRGREIPYDIHRRNNFYIFKLAFTNQSTKETSVWQFDGYNFEIPRGITKEAASYEIVLIIEEYQGDDFQGNIVDTPDSIERFVARPIYGTVQSTFYNPSLDITATLEETDQLAALIKPQIQCTLTDIGLFASDERELGQQYDNFIRYLKFNPNRITAHLNGFYLFALFKKGDLFYSSLFEKTHSDDPFDDHSQSHPVIAWIPTNVYESAGNWDVMIIGMAGSFENINESSDIGDYYFYVSNKLTMTVAPNKLSAEDVVREPTLSVISGLQTDSGEYIITQDGYIYKVK